MAGHLSAFTKSVEGRGETSLPAHRASRYELPVVTPTRLPGASLRFAKFGLVGLSGLLVNTLLLAALTREAGVFYLVSALVATELSIVWNFGLSEAWVFRDRAERGGRFRRFASFAAVGNAGFALAGPLLWLFVTVAGLQYLLGNIVSISLLMVARFVVLDKLIWRSAANADSLAAAPVWHVRRTLALSAAGGPVAANGVGIARRAPRLGIFRHLRRDRG
jgi:dolichol-phosphate mannosyltransferase